MFKYFNCYLTSKPLQEPSRWPKPKFSTLLWAPSNQIGLPHIPRFQEKTRPDLQGGFHDKIDWQHR